MDFQLNQALEILEQTPKTLSQFLDRLSDAWILNNEGETSWSPFDIMGHLIHGEITDWIPRVDIILSAVSDKTFRPFDRFAQFENSKDKILSDLLKDFSHLREQNLNYLISLNLKEAQLELKGIHPKLGSVSLKQLLAAWVAHDLSHIAQIARVMSKQYKSEVGPWQAYIPILNS